MYFTRDPVVETVITSKEGYKLTIRSTKNPSFEPIIVEALEIVSLGGVCFFRNSDRSKSFLLPVMEFEIIETRDARVNLKALGLEKGIKIAGGRTASLKIPKDKVLQPLSKTIDKEENKEENVESSDAGQELSSQSQVQVEMVGVEGSGSVKVKKSWKEKKQKQYNKKKLKELGEDRATGSDNSNQNDGKDFSLEESTKKFSLLPPPALLISEAMERIEELEDKIVDEVLNTVGVSSDEVDVSIVEEIQVNMTDPVEEEFVFFKEEDFPISSILDTDDL